MSHWFIILSVGAAAGMVLASRICLHYYQLESYQHAGFFRTLRRQWKRSFLPGLVMAAAAFALLLFMVLPACGHPFEIPAHFISALCLALIGCLFHRKAVRTAQKKKFVLTARMKRLYAMLGMICLLFMLLSFILVRSRALPLSLQAAACLLLSFLLPMALLPCLTALAGFLVLPAEKAINRMYMHDAVRRMDEIPGLIRVGITGSYGKTSVKNILNTILSQKYNVLSTPASFNTPMGLTRVIRERLEPAHQVFLAEMGARHRNDIRELTDFIRPSIGILTSVGPQHLDTFRSLENITETKYDLIRSLPDNGYAVFFDDEGICAELYDKTQNVPKIIVGRAGTGIWAEDLSVSADGSSFTLCFGNEKKLPCRTRLLGAHNIGNILLSCAVAQHLGLSDSQIQRGISMLVPVEHRLQLIPSRGGITVIDDAYNSNPRGARAALDVLAMFPGRRIIVTPGMVELGAGEDDYNREFGRQISGSADLCVLIGEKHTLPIREGLNETGFPPDHIQVFPDLTSAVAWLQDIMHAGDDVLYENDLPDHYSEN